MPSLGVALAFFPSDLLTFGLLGLGTLGVDLRAGFGGPFLGEIEVSGPERKIEAFLNVCRPYGIKSIARTGTIAMPRQGMGGDG